jgi:hypothetical protein
MGLQEWEQDVRYRQRNIVFPDTMLNAGRFYRNIASGRAVFSAGQRICLFLIVVFYVLYCSVWLAGCIDQFLVNKSIGLMAGDLWVGTVILAILFFWIFLAVKGLFPAPQATRKPRRGYRSNKST